MNLNKLDGPATAGQVRQRHISALVAGVIVAAFVLAGLAASMTQCQPMQASVGIPTPRVTPPTRKCPPGTRPSRAPGTYMTVCVKVLR